MPFWQKTEEKGKKEKLSKGKGNARDRDRFTAGGREERTERMRSQSDTVSGASQTCPPPGGGRNPGGDKGGQPPQQGCRSATGKPGQKKPTGRVAAVNKKGSRWRFGELSRNGRKTSKKKKRNKENGIFRGKGGDQIGGEKTPGSVGEGHQRKTGEEFPSGGGGSLLREGTRGSRGQRRPRGVQPKGRRAKKTRKPRVARRKAGGTKQQDCEETA